MPKFAKYREMYASLSKLTEAQVASAIEAELAGERRIEMLRRLLQRFNKLRGARVRDRVITLAASKDRSQVDIYALLDRHR